MNLKGTGDGHYSAAPEPFFCPPESLNHIVRPRGPSKQVGDVFKYVWGVFVASDWDVEVDETIGKLIRSKHVGIFNLGELCCQPFGDDTFWKHTPKGKT